MNAINLAKFRNQKRLAYMKRYGKRIETAARQCLTEHVHTTFKVILKRYLANRHVSEASWDYLEFRDLITTAIHETLSEKLLEQLKHEFWFDARYCSLDEITEIVLSQFIAEQIENTEKSKPAV
jgi:hypothetical protein